jgi:membrane protein DedA with SNARE-associated domain/rhodanese-related sulfurtransferase
MHQLILLMAQYGLLVVFAGVLLDEGGLPIPCFPILVVAGAATVTGHYSLLLVIAIAVTACVLADLFWYWAGKRYGRRILSLLCRISLAPDSCVRQTENLFSRVGPWSLLFVRYVPGLTNITVAMAAITPMPAATFILLNMAGAALYFGLPVLLGALFYRAIDDVLNTMVALGTVGIVAVLGALALYILLRWWQRQAFIRQLRMDRISVDELIGMIDTGNVPVILDVRSAATRARDGIIPGALPAHPQDIHPTLMEFDRSAEIVVYCACPNEASAATATLHLRKAGFRKIRPLLGGVDAWVAAGRPLTGTG